MSTQHPNSGNNPYQTPHAPQGAPIGKPGSSGPQMSVFAILSLVFGVLSLPLSICCGCFSAPLGIAGIVLGIIGINQIKAGTHTGNGLCYGGIACGAISLLIAVVLLILNLVFSIGAQGGQFDF